MRTLIIIVVMVLLAACNPKKNIELVATEEPQKSLQSLTPSTKVSTTENIPTRTVTIPTLSPIPSAIKYNPGDIVISEAVNQFPVGNYQFKLGYQFDSGPRFGKTPCPSIELGDLDNDGDLDIVIHSMENDSMIQVYENLGKGYFRNSGAVFPYEPHKENMNFGISLIDINEDNLLDIISADAWSGLNIYLNQGYFGFIHNQHYTFSGFNEIKGVTTGDFDGDGDVDIATGEHNGNKRGDRILFNNGSGYMIDTNQALGFDVTWDMFSIDLNRDGYLDLITVNRYGYETSKIYFNDGTGYFSDRKIIPHSFEDSYDIKCFSTNFYSYCVIANGEYARGAPEEFQRNNKNSIIIFDVEGEITEIREFGEIGLETKSLCILDFNDDGVQDIIVGNYNEQSYVYYGEITNNTEPLQFRDYVALGSWNASAIGCGDLNGDNKPDIVVGLSSNTPEGSYIILFQN